MGGAVVFTHLAHSSAQYSDALLCIFARLFAGEPTSEIRFASEMQLAEG